MLHRIIHYIVIFACLAQSFLFAIDTKTQLRLPASLNNRLMVRIKDIAMFTTLRDNQLVGYGLVVGLNGTGDSLGSSPYTKESLISMLERLGVNIRDGAIPSGKSIAAVMVTATLPPFARLGSRININVSVLGDAKDLRGGTLLVTPLLAADGDVYAVGQGTVNASGLAAAGAAASQTTGVPTTGTIPSGAIVEKEINFQLASVSELTLGLRNPDITTAHRIRTSLNQHFRNDFADALDNATIRIKVPDARRKDIVAFMNEIEHIEVSPDERAKVIIDPNTGVIVMTKGVRISSVALNHGDVTIRVVEHPDVYQPNPFTNVLPPSIVPDTQQTSASNFLLSQIKNKNTQFDRDLKSRETSLHEQVDEIRARYQPQIIAAAPGQARDAVIALRETAITNAYTAFNEREKVLRASHQASLNNLQDNLNDVNQEGNSSRLIPVSGATVVNDTTLDVKEEKGKFALLDQGVDLQELVNALNLLGVSSREMMHILEGLQRAGALHAEVIVT